MFFTHVVSLSQSFVCMCGGESIKGLHCVFSLTFCFCVCTVSCNLKNMDGVESNNEEINSDANCSCEENDMENEDNNYPDYSYRKRVNYLYTEISGDRCKKYQCLLCSFETEHLSSMQRHFLRHTNTRSYSCQKCEYSARTNGDLKVHMLYRCGKPKFTAGGEHQCNLCEYSTFDKHYLQSHHRCHSGERPFACDQCKYRCARKDVLKIHKVTHTPREKTFICDKCDCRYTNKSSLTFHVKTKHSQMK